MTGAQTSDDRTYFATLATALDSNDTHSDWTETPSTGLNSALLHKPHHCHESRDQVQFHVQCQRGRRSCRGGGGGSAMWGWGRTLGECLPGALLFY